MFKLQDGSDGGTRHITEYRLKDVELPLTLMDKLICFPNYIEMAGIIGVPCRTNDVGSTDQDAIVERTPRYSCSRHSRHCRLTNKVTMSSRWSKYIDLHVRFQLALPVNH